jgi:RNA polymerase sigma-70 factor (ECF subfamily)
VAELDGPKAGLAVLDALSDDKRLDTYQPYWAARASLCARVARHEEARKAYDLAIGLENDPANREFLILRRKAVEG